MLGLKDDDSISYWFPEIKKKKDDFGKYVQGLYI